jgi:glycosyltransferase involved in cell wall biosynthesis
MSTPLPDQRGDVLEVSVVVIAYNEAARIAACLTALTAQQYAGTFEVLVVDDGSTDATAAIADGFGGNVRVVRQGNNRGRGAARARGVAESRGALVGFVDADCTVPANWLDACVAAVRNGAGAVSGIAVPDGDVAVIARITGAAPRPVRGSGTITGNNVVFDGGVLRRTGFDPNARLGEDFRLERRLTRAGVPLQCLTDLHVRHDERKTYRKALTWLYESGRDATALLAEFREVRTPDIAWMVWVSSVVGALAWGYSGGGLWLLAGPIVVAGAISGAHVATRFTIRRPVRWVWAQLANLPLMLCYLVGRCIGVANLAWRAARGRVAP